MRSILLLLCIFIFSTVNAGVLGDLFSNYASLSCITAEDITTNTPGAIKATITMPTPNSRMVSEYPAAVSRFIKDLPQKYRMNHGRLVEGEPEVFFCQPSPTANAEAVIIMREDGIYIITYYLLSPKDGKEFKAEFEQTLSK